MNNHLFKFISTANSSRTLGLLLIMVIMAAIPLTIYIGQQVQDTRQKAAEKFPNGTACQRHDECFSGWCKETTEARIEHYCSAQNPPTPTLTSTPNLFTCTSYNQQGISEYGCYSISTGCPSNMGVSSIGTCPASEDICCYRNLRNNSSPTPTPTPTPTSTPIPSSGGGGGGGGNGDNGATCPFALDTCRYSEADGRCFSGHGATGFNVPGCAYSCGPIACPTSNPNPVGGTPTASTATPNPTQTATTAPACDNSHVAMNAAQNGTSITFSINGSQGSTLTGDTWTGGVNCSGNFFGTKTCNTTTNGTFRWIHTWQNCAPNNCDIKSQVCSQQINYTVTTLNPADVNRDGRVDSLDFDEWLYAFQHNGTSRSSNYRPDINNDGKVDLTDYNLWFQASQ